MARASIGVSGWRYPRWRGDFYPEGLVQRRELEYVASRMTSVEVNGSFYSLLRPSTYAAIAEQTPDDFLVAVKGSRYITHLKRLREVETPLANFFGSGVLALGQKLGPFLWQLPPDLRYDEELLRRFFELLPRSTSEVAQVARRHDQKLGKGRSFLDVLVERPVRHAIEVRHTSFCSADAVELLREHDVALVLADSAGRWPFLEERTSDFMYARLHGHTELYASGYSPKSLDEWARKVASLVAEGLDAHVYFDNDSRGRAPYDAVGLLERLRRLS